MRHKTSFAAVLMMAGLICLIAHPAKAGGTPDELARVQLGKVNFPTSCTAAVQPTIEKGVALLHSFEYQEVEQTFKVAVTLDPQCAMAHWGMAMAWYHQLWDFPDEKTLKQGRKEIATAQKLHAATKREQGFLNAAATFFQKKSKLTHAERIGAYSTVMEKFYAESAGDVEIGAFYALSLVSLADADVDTTANLKKAMALLDPMLRQFPDHPGVAHYLIHAADRPEFASQGLEAARRYAAIAPDSSHALHMPSHIFVRLGLWQDSINSNIAADRSGAHAAEMHMAESHYQTHARDFLSYSYLQSGQESSAREVIERTTHVVGASTESKADETAYLAARTALELHHWKEAAALPIPPVRKNWLDSTYWARAIGAARSGDVAGAQAAVRELTRLVAAREKRSRKSGYNVSSEKATDLREAEAWLAFANGKPEDGLEELRAAAARQDKSGGDSVGIPAREMLADMLLELNRSGDALAEYRTELKLSPNRFNALLGAARAAKASGASGPAQGYYAQLTQICPASADRSELAEARTASAEK